MTEEESFPADVGPGLGSAEDLHAVAGGPAVLCALRAVRAARATGVAASGPGRQHHGPLAGRQGQPQRLGPSGTDSPFKSCTACHRSRINESKLVPNFEISL